MTVYCTVWKFRELMEECIDAPADQETLHIENGPHASWCGKSIYQRLPFIKEVGDDVKVCKRCENAERRGFCKG